MPTISSAPSLAQPKAAPSALDRVMSLIAHDRRPGGGLEDLNRSRDDEFGFGRLRRLVEERHPSAVAPLHDWLGSVSMTRSSARVAVANLCNLIEFGSRLGIDVLDCGEGAGAATAYERAVRVLQAARERGSLKGKMLSASTVQLWRHRIATLHIANGRDDPFTALGARKTKLVEGLIKRWIGDDEDTTGGRAGATGVAAREPIPSIGYLTGGSLNMGHVARLNARAGGSIDRHLLREQAFALTLRETHATPKQLLLMRGMDLELGAERQIWLHGRADEAAGKNAFKISTALARLLRLLADDVLGAGASWSRLPLFQALSGGRSSRWTGRAADFVNPSMLRRMLQTAAEQARARGEEDVGPPDAVAALLRRISWESIRDGVLVDCHASGVAAVALAVVLRKRSMVEIDRLYRREDERLGLRRIGGRSK